MTRLALALTLVGSLVCIVPACNGQTFIGSGGNGVEQDGGAGAGGAGGGGTGGSGGGGECTVDGDCPHTESCALCADGTSVCDSARCEGGTCVGVPGRCGWQPCAGAPCGAPCSPCDPRDVECVSDAALHTCDGEGQCVAGLLDCPPPPLCTSDAECPQPGAACQVCPDGTVACPSVSCVDGQCVGSFPSCGGGCTADSDCPQSMAPCQLCPDGSSACPFAYCVGGECVGGFEGCGGYDPCAGVACGAPCALCPPNDPTCVAPAVMTWCNERGTCDTTFPTTCGGGGGTCTSDAECPGVGACPPCPDGGCAELACINGGCEFRCANPTPECAADADCPAIELCLPCADGNCAASTCVLGRCELVCGG